MSWIYRLTKRAYKDLDKLDNSVRKTVLKALDKVSTNPLPNTEGGYGKPLSGELSGCCKIKLKSNGVRIVYKLKRIKDEMVAIVIGLRADSEVYKQAEDRIAVDRDED